VLKELRDALTEIGRELPLLFPVHPRTRERIQSIGQDWSPVRLVEPLGYLDFLGLMAQARLVLTDSGGIQEETTALGVPCVTMRDNTERPITVTEGTNQIAGTRRSGIVTAARRALDQEADSAPRIPLLWDGSAASRTGDVLMQWIESQS
jgi:UDP-N-acetylglucosamine 2-epimerase (non-hydrolysing)